MASSSLKPNQRKRKGLMNISDAMQMVLMESQETDINPDLSEESECDDDSTTEKSDSIQNREEFASVRVLPDEAPGSLVYTMLSTSPGPDVEGSRTAAVRPPVQSSAIEPGTSASNVDPIPVTHRLDVGSDGIAEADQIQNADPLLPATLTNSMPPSPAEADSDVSTVDFNNSTASIPSSPLPENPPQARRSKKPAPDTWTRNVQKLARLEGRAYLGCNKSNIAAKVVGEGCSSRACVRSSKRDCSFFTAGVRQSVFNRFWAMPSWSERVTYVKTLVTKKETSQQTAGPSSQRSTSFLYFLISGDNERRPVCKKLFCSTLGMSAKTIHNWLTSHDATKNSEAEQGPSTDPPSSGKYVPLTLAEKTYIRNWLRAIPTVPSHYCRKQPAYADKHFIFQGKTLSSLHNDYVQDCERDNVRSVGRKYFTDVFKDLNMSFFHPRKDQCDKCISAKLGLVRRDEHEVHIRAKNNAQQEKANDKARADDTTSVWTMDLQALLQSPSTKASALYYKTKLNVHNMTYFNYGTKEGFCYTYDETEGDLSSNMFASLHHQHFASYILKNPGIKRIILWSDGCGYQNKCTAVSNAFLQLSSETGVTIEHKYLVPGHTQMECDSIHSTIERKLVVDLLLPHDYATVMKLARQNPFPYEVKEINHSYTTKLSPDFVKSVRPGKKVGDPKVTDVRAYKYFKSEDGMEMFFKLDWEEDWQEMPVRVSQDVKTWTPLFLQRLPITSRKFEDLQAMKPVMEQYAHEFYDNLPHD